MPNQPFINPPWFRGRAPGNLIKYQPGPTQYVPRGVTSDSKQPISLPPGLGSIIKPIVSGLLPNKISNALFARPTYANALADPSIYAHATPRPLSSGIGSVGTPGGLHRLSTFANPNALPAAYATPLPSAQSAFATPAFGGQIAPLAAPAAPSTFGVAAASPLSASAPALATSVAPQAFGVAAASPLSASGVAAAAPAASATAAPAASLAPFLGPAALGGLFALKHPRRPGFEIVEVPILYTKDGPIAPGSKNASPDQIKYVTDAADNFYETFKGLDPQFNPQLKFEGSGRGPRWTLNIGGINWFTANTYPELLALAKKYMPDEVSNPLLSLGPKERLAAYQKTGQFTPPEPVTRINPLTGKPQKKSIWASLKDTEADRNRKKLPINWARTQQNLRLGLA